MSCKHTEETLSTSPHTSRRESRWTFVAGVEAKEIEFNVQLGLVNSKLSDYRDKNVPAINMVKKYYSAHASALSNLVQIYKVRAYKLLLFKVFIFQTHFNLIPFNKSNGLCNSKLYTLGLHNL